MKIKKLNIEGSFSIDLNPHDDYRGFFMRTYDHEVFKSHKLNFNWVQENHSKTVHKNVIRGLHFQLPPFQETKLIRCIRGKILDVFVDLRKDSKTFGQWDSIILSEENKKEVLVPRGCAHGFLTLSENSEVCYKVDNFYSKTHERGLIWNDSTLNIKWNLDGDPILSEKDKLNKNFKDLIK